MSSKLITEVVPVDRYAVGVGHYLWHRNVGAFLIVGNGTADLNSNRVAAVGLKSGYALAAAIDVGNRRDLTRSELAKLLGHPFVDCWRVCDANELPNVLLNELD